MSDPDVTAIAKGRTKARRRALAEADHIAGYYLVSAHAAVRKGLREAGCITTYSVWRDKITPLGLLVRAHLLAERPTDAG